MFFDRFRDTQGRAAAGVILFTIPETCLNHILTVLPDRLLFFYTISILKRCNARDLFEFTMKTCCIVISHAFKYALNASIFPDKQPS